MSKKYEKRIERLKKNKNNKEENAGGSKGIAQKYDRSIESEKKAQKRFKKKMNQRDTLW